MSACVAHVYTCAKIKQSYMSHFTGGWPLIGIPEEGPWSINSSYFLYENAHGGGAFFSIFLFFDFVTMNNSYYIPYVCRSLHLVFGQATLVFNRQ